MRYYAGMLLSLAVLLSAPALAEPVTRFARHDGMRIEGALISTETVGEDDITCPELCGEGCVAARQEENQCSLLSSVTGETADPAFKTVSWAAVSVELSELRHDRAAELSFLHPDIIRRADQQWRNLPIVDGASGGIPQDVLELLEKGQPGRAEPGLLAAFAANPQESATWRKGAEALLASLVVHRPDNSGEADGLHETVLSAATNAYLTALDTHERVGALAVLADAFAQTSDYASAAATGRYRLNFIDDGAFAASVEAWETEAKNQPPAPQPSGNLHQTLGAWSLSCDNARSCTASAYAPDEYLGAARIDLWRDASPSAALHVAVYTQFEDQALLSVPAENLFFDGVEHAAAILEPMSWRKEDGFASMLPLSAGTPMLVEAIVKSDEMFVRKAEGADVLATVPVAGAADVLAFFSKHQGRAGGQLQTASAPPLPVIEPEMLEPQIISTPAPANVTGAWKAACDEADFIAENGQAVPVGHRLREGLDLWFILCTSGAYNFGSMAFLDRSGVVEQVLFDQPSETGLVTNDDHLWNVDVVQAFNELRYEEPALEAAGPKPVLLHSYSRGRGIGDCGIIATHVFDGERFRLFEQARMDDCKGWREPWPVDWRSAQFGDRSNESENEAKAAEAGGPALTEARFAADYDACSNDPAADTASQIACADAEMKAWDKRLNAAYKAFGAANPGPLAAAAKTAQRAWIKSRDANCALLVSLTGDGSMAGPASAHCLARETAWRADFLEQLSGTLPAETGGGGPLTDGAFTHAYGDCLDAEQPDCAAPETEFWSARLAKAEKAVKAAADAVDAFGKSDAAWRTERDLSCKLSADAQSAGDAAYGQKLSAHCALTGLARRTLMLERWTN